MNADLRSALQRLPGPIDILRTGACQAANGRPFDLLRDPPNRLEVPGELYANPASMISTPKRASCLATMTFSSTFMLAPGDCSPSRKVVSKILIIRCHISHLISSYKKCKSLHPSAQGRRLQKLRGTTLIRPWTSRESADPSFSPSRGQGGIHYSRFTDSARRRVRQITGWFAPPASSLQTMRLPTTPRRAVKTFVRSPVPASTGTLADATFTTGRSCVPSGPRAHSRRRSQIT